MIAAMNRAQERPHDRANPASTDVVIRPPSVDEIFGRLSHAHLDNRASWATTLEAAGLNTLDGTSASEAVETVLLRLREALPKDLDSLSREGLRVELRKRFREQGAQVSARMIDAALEPYPLPSVENRPRASQATQIVDLALEAGVELWHSPAGEAHVTIPVEEHFEHYRLAARGFSSFLARLYHRSTRAVAAAQSIADATKVLDGRARFDGETRAAATRVAAFGDCVYLDLGDGSWRAVEVSPAGWHICARPPVRFVRSTGMRPLCVPTTGGSIVGPGVSSERFGR